MRDNLLIMDNIAKNIKNLRLHRGLSQKALAKLCGWETNSRIANYETEGTGKREPSLRDIKVIAKALNVSPATLAFDDMPAKGNFPLPGVKGLPILDKKNILDWPSNKDIISSSDKLDFLADKLSLGLNSFIYELEDESMYNFTLHEGFRKGTKVIIDPNREYELGKSCVLVKSNNFIKVRQITEDEEGIVLIPFNNDLKYPRKPFTSDFKIIGVVVAHLGVLI